VVKASLDDGENRASGVTRLQGTLQLFRERPLFKASVSDGAQEFRISPFDQAMAV